jgi:hypothetical protein
LNDSNAEESKGKPNDTASFVDAFPTAHDKCIRGQVSDEQQVQRIHDVCQDNNVHSREVTHHRELTSFWQFLLLMMLRQVGIDYVSSRSAHIQSAAENSTDRSSMVMDEEIPEM